MSKLHREGAAARTGRAMCEWPSGKRRQPVSRTLTCSSRDPFILLPGIHSAEVVVDGVVVDIHAVS